MGHKVGSLTLHAGIAGGADIILIPEIPYDIEKVVEAIQKRSKAGKRFTILAVAEGAISKEDALLSKKDYKKKLGRLRRSILPYPMKLQTRLPRSLVLRYALQFRDIHSEVGAPCAYDRVLSTRIGAGAAEAILDGEYGIMIGIVMAKSREYLLKNVPAS